MTIKGIDHVQVTITEGSDNEAREFYCNFLGLQEVEKPEELKRNGGFWLVLGDMQVHIGIENDVIRHISKAHIAYEVTDIDSWRQRLSEQQIEFKEDTPIQGFDRLSFRDPFGNKIEFLEPCN